jgi:hypothetical protein
MLTLQGIIWRWVFMNTAARDRATLEEEEERELAKPFKCMLLMM